MDDELSWWTRLGSGSRDASIPAAHVTVMPPPQRPHPQPLQHTVSEYLQHCLKYTSDISLLLKH